MRTKELISVIVPVYNGEKTIEKCLYSILNCKQEPDIEVIVVNNGSTDRTLEIVEEFALKDTRVRIYSQENQGPAGSRNTGLKLAKGEYISYCDSDDWVEPSWLDHMYRNLIKFNADVSCCRAIIEGKTVTYNPNEVLEWDRDEAIEEFLKHEKINGCLWNKMIRRELLEGIEFDLSQWYWEDLAVVWKVLKRVNKVVRCDEGTYHFFIHPESMCAQKISRQRVRDSFLVWDTIYTDCQMPELSIHKERATEMRNSIYIGEMIAMFKGGLQNEELELKIKKTLTGISLTKLFKSLSLEKFLIALMSRISFKLTRRIIHTFA